MSAAAPIAMATLRGHSILVIEDEYMIAEEIAAVLRNAGAEVLGPVSRIGDAIGLLAAEARIDGAILDVSLSGEAVWPVVDALLARGVPMLLATGYDAGAIHKAYTHLPRIEKPATGQDLARALARNLSAAVFKQSNTDKSA